MVYEKRLGTRAQLADELQTLDFDAGIRVLGKHEGEPCFIFITKAGERFVAAVHARRRAKSGAEVPDKELMLKEYGNIALLLKLIDEEATEPFEAYSY